MKHPFAFTFSNGPIQVFFQLLTCLGKSVYTTGKSALNVSKIAKFESDSGLSKSFLVAG